MTEHVPPPTPDGRDEPPDHDAGMRESVPDEERWPRVLREVTPPSMANPGLGDHAVRGHDDDRHFPHRAYERLAGYCAATPAAPSPLRPQTPRVGPAGRGPAVPVDRWHPSQGRPDVCPRCDAHRSCCHCESDVDDLRLFARRMAELHQPTGTPVCGCGAHQCYVRRRLDAIGRQARP